MVRKVPNDDFTKQIATFDGKKEERALQGENW